MALFHTDFVRNCFYGYHRRPKPVYPVFLETASLFASKMSDTEGEDERRRPKGVFSTLVANGDWFYQKGEYKKAIENYTKVGS